MIPFKNRPFPCLPIHQDQALSNACCFPITVSPEMVLLPLLVNSKIKCETEYIPDCIKNNFLPLCKASQVLGNLFPIAHDSYNSG